MRSPHAGQLASGITTSLISLVVMLVVLEGLVRWLAPEPIIPRVYVSDPVLWHAMRPHVRAVYRTPRFKTIIETNADGFRDVEFHPKPAGAIRILVIGDSFTAGAEVPARDTYPKVLERRLRKRPGGGRYEVFNLGVRAYGTLQEIRLLETRGLSYQPDVVILQAYAVNDLYESFGPLYTEQNGNMLSPVAQGPGATVAAAVGEGPAHENRAGMGSGGGIKRWLARHSQLYLFARARYQALRLRARGESGGASNSELVRRSMAVYARTETGSIQAGWARVDSLMQSLASLSARHGFRVVVTNAPARGLRSGPARSDPGRNGGAKRVPLCEPAAAADRGRSRWEDVVLAGGRPLDEGGPPTGGGNALRSDAIERDPSRLTGAFGGGLRIV